MVKDESFYLKELATKEATYGPDHPEVAITLHDLGYLLATMARYSDAESILRRSLAIREATYGPDHAEVALSQFSIARTLFALSRYDEAEPLIRRSLSISEAALGPRNPIVAVTLQSLGELLVATNRCDEAEAVYQQSLTIMEAALGSRHPQVVATRESLAELSNDRSCYHDAEDLSDSDATKQRSSTASRYEWDDPLGGRWEIDTGAGTVTRFLSSREQHDPFSVSKWIKRQCQIGWMSEPLGDEYRRDRLVYNDGKWSNIYKTIVSWSQGNPLPKRVLSELGEKALDDFLSGF